MVFPPCSHSMEDFGVSKGRQVMGLGTWVAKTHPFKEPPLMPEAFREARPLQSKFRLTFAFPSPTPKSRCRLLPLGAPPRRGAVATALDSSSCPPLTPLSRGHGVKRPSAAPLLSHVGPESSRPLFLSPSNGRRQSAKNTFSHSFLMLVYLTTTLF